MHPAPARPTLLALLAVLCLPAAAQAQAQRQPDTIPGRYVVLYESSVDDPAAETEERERRHGFSSDLRYGRAIKGFAAHLSPPQVERLEADPEVALVSPDRRVRATATLAAGEAVPTGIRRMQAARGSTVRGASSVNVGVIDTGIDLEHPDLLVAGGKDCVNPGTTPDDDEGHGTHVAGSIAARNTGNGVVGVAPGTRLFAAKVLNSKGEGTSSQVICGIDWVTSTRTDADATNDIAVANMSLGGSGPRIRSCAQTTDAEHKAICRSTAAGVTYVVAAGNDGWDFDYAPVPDTPAAYPEVLTVTAVSDSDGLPGAGGGAPSCSRNDADDRFARFSNYALTTDGKAHTVAAPGVCIRSSIAGGGYDTYSGTSMASPHAAGAVALCLGEGGAAGPCTGMTPAEIVNHMRTTAATLNAANPWFGFAGDPLRPVSDRFYGHLLYAGTGAPVEPGAENDEPPRAVTVQRGTLAGGDVESLAEDDADLLRVDSVVGSGHRTNWQARFGGVPASIGSLTVRYRGSNSSTCTQRLEIRRNDQTWLELDSRSVGTTETLIEETVPGTLSSYINATGNIFVRVRCATSAGPYTSRGDLLRITYS